MLEVQRRELQMTKQTEALEMESLRFKNNPH